MKRRSFAKTSRTPVVAVWAWLLTLAFAMLLPAEEKGPQGKTQEQEPPRAGSEKTAQRPPGGGAQEKAGSTEKSAPRSALDFAVKDIDGKEVRLNSYEGKVLLVVNVASRCGLTEKQYSGLESLYQKYKDRGFEILGFPANDFGSQEPGTDPEIKAFCASKGATFKVFSKISVKGPGIHPLYKFLTSVETNGKFAGDIRWNFQKFLIGADGEVAARFEPAVDPLAKEVTDAVEKALKRAKPKVENEKAPPKRR